MFGIKVMKSFSLITSVIALLTLTGCESANSGLGGVLSLDTNLTLTLLVDADINPDESDRPSPLYVRFYQLKSTKAFEKADFIQLYEQDESILGDDFIKKDHLKSIQPGKGREEKFVLSEDTEYIAMYAEFFQFKDSKYKIIFPVTSNNIFRNKVKVKISGNEIQLVQK